MIPHTLDYIAELELIEASRRQRQAIDEANRWWRRKP